MDYYTNITLLVFCAWLAVVTTYSCETNGHFQKLPRPMKLSTYKEMVSGRLAQVPYRLESPKWPFATNRVECVFTLVEPTNETDSYQVTVQVKYNKNSEKCVHIFSLRNHISEGSIEYAVFDARCPGSPEN